MRSRYLLVSLVVALAGVACGDDDGGSMTTPDAGPDMITPPPPRDMGPPVDMGPRPDMGPPVDMGPRPDMAMPPPGDLPTCDEPLVVEGRIGLATAMVDTTGGGAPADDFGACQTYLDDLAESGFEIGARRAQAVIAYEVPGTGSVGIEFTTSNPGTTLTDSIVEVRTGASCDDGAAAECFDDTAMDDFLSTGTVSAMGGDTIYFIVSGFPYGMKPDGAVTEGTIQITFTAAMNAAPTLTGLTAAQTFPAGGDPLVTITMMGGDPDGNAAGAEIELLDAMGAVIDIDGDGVGDENDIITGPFDDPGVDGMMTFTATVTLTGDAAEFGGAQVRARIVDAFDSTSSQMTAMITGLSAGPGEACDMDTPCRMPAVCAAGTCRLPAEFGEMCDMVIACAPPNVCTAGTCQATPEATAACAAAAPITLDAMSSGMAMGTLMPGDGLFEGSCSATGGTEALFTVTIPAGMHDLVADTAVLGTDEMADTVVYIRSTCADSREMAEVACSDDEEDTRGRAAFENATAGTYTIFVEDFNGVEAMMTTPFALRVYLRPVLGAGAACDDMGLANRCSTGPCAMGTCPPMM
ncbi:MAG: hypothetical protein IT379_20320 [Deltaproteobacteria bacterium]|nr:hypothetical protein [Deltaproteobacteria bacterium]